MPLGRDPDPSAVVKFTYSVASGAWSREGGRVEGWEAAPFGEGGMRLCHRCAEDGCAMVGKVFKPETGAAPRMYFDEALTQAVVIQELNRGVIDIDALKSHDSQRIGTATVNVVFR